MQTNLTCREFLECILIFTGYKVCRFLPNELVVKRFSKLPKDRSLRWVLY